MKRHSTLAVAVLAILLLSGCSAAVSSTDAGSDPAVVVGDEARAPEELAPDSAADAAIVVTGDLVMTVDDPAETADDIVGLIVDDGGSIALREENRGDDGGDGSRLVLRIPTASFDATLLEITALGTQDSLSVRRTDVGDQVVDLDARIHALQTSVDRLLALMASAATT